MSTNWTSVTNIVSEGVNVLAPLIETADPALGVAMGVLSKIIAGVVASEPTALALYNQIQSGAPVTASQLTQFASDYEDAYQKLNADINAKLAQS